MCSVLFLKGPTYEMSQLVSQHNPNAFFYSFEYEGRNSIFNYLFAVNTPPFPPGMSRISYLIFTEQWTHTFVLNLGVSHADEMIYLFIFPFPSIPPGLNRTETELSKKMLQVWTNFVIFGQVHFFCYFHCRIDRAIDVTWFRCFCWYF